MKEKLKLITKKIEIPSTPRLKFKLEDGIHAKSYTNWKRACSLSKKTHKNKERKNTKNEEANPVNLIAFK